MFVHYGSNCFDPHRWMDIKNRDFGNKPVGGLWASPVNAERGWYQWCEAERFNTHRLRSLFAFDIQPTARVLVLTPDNVWDLPITAERKKMNKILGITEQETRKQRLYVDGIDFEKISKSFDVLECSLTEYPELYWSLYGWDCDCILVLNKNVIKVVEADG